MTSPKVVIVDYGLGNLYSVLRACTHVAIDAVIERDPAKVVRADGVILPGVGAFGDAMTTLRERGLDDALRSVVEAGTPFMGICLGVQLLMSESEEFGQHRGLDVIPGSVTRFDAPREGERLLKVPQVGWNRVHARASWDGTPLEAMAEGQHMYFVHSYFVQPRDPSVILSTTRYGQIEFCSSLRRGNLFACQFHPERSGPEGLEIYRTWGKLVAAHKNGETNR